MYCGALESFGWLITVLESGVKNKYVSISRVEDIYMATHSKIMDELMVFLDSHIKPACHHLHINHRDLL